MAVGFAPDLKSPYEVEDIGWHIREWTADLYKPYSKGWTAEKKLQKRALRGLGGTTFEREAYREKDTPETDVGFRCVFP